MKYKIDNIKNYSGKRDWLCGHFFEEGDLSKTEALEVKVSTMKKGDFDKEHFHPQGTEIVVILKGELRYRLEGKEYIVSDGDFVILRNQVKEEVVEALKETTYIVARAPSIKNNKTYT